MSKMGEKTAAERPPQPGIIHTFHEGKL